jgi:hypothetical protein
MSEPNENPPPEPDPHGIDHTRELRLVKIFAVLIGGAFILVVVMLVAAFSLDIIHAPEPIEPVPIVPDPEPLSEQADLAGNHP